jgi:hypothetical protein
LDDNPWQVRQRSLRELPIKLSVVAPIRKDQKKRTARRATDDRYHECQ